MYILENIIIAPMYVELLFVKHFHKPGLIGSSTQPSSKAGQRQPFPPQLEMGLKRRLTCSRSQTRGRIRAGTQVSVAVHQGCGKYFPCAKSCAGFRDTRMNQKSIWLLVSKAQQKSQE